MRIGTFGSILSLLSILFVSFTPKLFSQQKQYVINSGEVIKKGMALHDERNYKEAISEYQKIPEHDTNYLWALYEVVMSARTDSQYNLAISTCNKALAIKPNMFEHDLLIQMSGVYNDKEQFDSSAFYANKAYTRFPNSYMTIQSIGITYYLQKKYDSAYACFEKAILNNPYAYNSHYFLGLIARDKGYPVHAMMSLTMSLLVAPESPRVNQIIKIMYNLSNLSDKVLEYYTNRTEEKFIKEDYSELEIYFKSKIALEKKYEIQTKFDEAVFRQMNLIFEKMPAGINHSDDLWSAFYAPVFHELFSRKLFGAATILMVSGLNDERISKLVKENKRDIEEAGKLIHERLDEIGYHRSYKRSEYKDGPGYLFDQNRLVALGSFLNNDKKTQDGKWIVYNKVGDIEKIIHFKNGKYEGKYESFFYEGKPFEAAEYANNKLHGENLTYFRNGVLQTRETIIDDKREGLYQRFYSTGSPELIYHYKNNKRNNPSELFYDSGCKQYDVVYENDEPNGPVKEYYSDGHLFATYTVVKGKEEGEKKIYYENGALKEKGSMHENEKEGLFTTYFPDGSVNYTENYKKGKLNGPSIYYHTNGKESIAINYSNGEQEGASTRKDQEGRIEMIDEYKKGHLKKVAYYNVLNGQMMKENIIEDKEKNTIAMYNSTGQLIKQAVCDRDGNYNGEYKEFFLNGAVSVSKQYTNGNANGTSFTYFMNGKVEKEVNYKDGKLDGIYKAYFSNGKLNTEGMYVDGNQQGYWYTYDSRGTLISTEYFIDDQNSGNTYTYYPSGKLKSKVYWKEGREEHFSEYDTLTHLIQDVELTPGELVHLTQHNAIGIKDRTFDFQYNAITGTELTFYPNGQTQSITNYKYGRKDSTYITYFSNGKVNVRGTYMNNQKVGAWITYDRYGKPESIYHYNLGEVSGIDTVFTARNTLETTIEFVGDNRHGWYSQYAINGDLMYKLHYIDGNTVGYTYQLPDGSLVKEIPLLPQDTHVDMKAFYKNGKPSSICGYKGGEFDGKRILYFPDGKIYYEANFILGDQLGDETEYYENGQVNNTRHYKENELDGLITKHSDKGILLEELQFVNGYQHGTTKYYDQNGSLLQTITYYWDDILKIE